jgi:glycosyltransferase involved in cell wall biosynthesis
MWTVSVIIPVYNGERYLAAAIESVLAQSHRPTEVIVVDDGSTDGSAAIARDFPPVQYTWQANAGTAAARNSGVALARGDLLAFLDADDLWTPCKLERQAAALQADPDLEAVFGHLQQFHSPELDDARKAAIVCPTEIVPACTPGAMLIQRAAFFRVGLFNASFVLGEGIDWYLRATEAGLKMLVLPEVVYLRRLHTTNQGILKRHAQRAYLHVLKASLDRKRQRKESEESLGCG